MESTPLPSRQRWSAKNRGVRVIDVTSDETAKQLPKDFVGKHSSGKILHEMFDLVLLTQVPYGDAIINMEGCETPVGPYSAYGNAFVCNSSVIETTRILLERGFDPPLIRSINVVGGAEENQRLYKKYRKRVRWL